MQEQDKKIDENGVSPGVDTHAHLNLSPLKKDIAGAVSRAWHAGVGRIGNVFLTPQQYFRDRVTFADFSQVFFLLGIHPHEADSVGPGALDELRDAVQSDSRIRAVGEIGLDFYRDRSSRSSQREIFRQQLEMAREMDWPVVVHSRGAEEETMQILQEMGFRDRPLLWHCFSLNADYASRLLDCGWTISVPGIVTYKKADPLRRAVSTIPLESLVLETDSPFLAPEPYRGKTNEPSLIPCAAAEVAKTLGMETERLMSATAATAHSFFGLDRD